MSTLRLEGLRPTATARRRRPTLRRRHLHVFRRHVPDVLGEVPLVPFQVFDGIAAVAVELVRGIVEDLGASGAGPFEMLVHLIDENVLKLVDADLRGTDCDSRARVFRA